MRVFRIYTPYVVTWVCIAFLANCSYDGSHFGIVLFVLLSLFWLRQFYTTHKFFKLSDEFESLIAEAERRIEAGAPAKELIEMAQDRLDKMTRL
jgi:Flp pilus assembly protein TadB